MLALPGPFAARFAPPGGILTDIREPAHALVFGLGGMLLSLGLVPLVGPYLRTERARRWLAIAGSVAAYLALSSCLLNWMIDDAAITFAYSENLVLGHGLTLHPALPPEEAYSNTLWMLWLALLRMFGVAIPVAAKLSCLAIGALTIGLLHAASARLEGNETGRWLILTAVLLGAPYLVWSGSGLEHGLQGLALLLCVILPLFTTRHVAWLSGVSLSALVLVRPEAPLLVIACFAVHLYQAHAQTKDWLQTLRQTWLVAFIPGAVWVALIAFRLAYFGDPLANPYYVKASDATFARLLNLTGGAWEYLYAWAFGSGIFVALPAVARACRRPLPLPINMALVLSATHLVFVLYARGDWMGCWRFVSPIIPMLALVIAWAYSRPRAETPSDVAPGADRLVAWATVAILAVGGFRQYFTFLANPTTPYALVAIIGEQFVDLGKRLGVTEPLLAHHDAGGTSYTARIKLLDLGGLGNRAIAKHMNDAEFLTHYILDEEKPDFVFGVAHNFASGASLFWQRPQFESDYVRVEFPEKPYMKSDLSYVKRKLVEQRELPPGIELVRSGSLVTAVVVR